MALRTASTLKFVGSISLGLLTGVSYSLSTLTLPFFSALPSATSASRAFSNLTHVSLTHLRALVTVSSSSFLIAYLLSPRSQKHPYLLWTSLFVAASGLTEFALPGARSIATASASARAIKPKAAKSQGRQMDASYEVLGASDRDSEGHVSGEEAEEEINGEEVQQAIEGFIVAQVARTVLAGIAFTMSVVGIWGDGATDLVILEM